MLTFNAQKVSNNEQISCLAALTDWPCVWSETWLRAYTPNGGAVFVFQVLRDNYPVAIAFGILSKRFLRGTLNLPTYPRFLESDSAIDAIFWDGLHSFCRKHHVLLMHLNSFETLTPLCTDPGFDKLVSKKTRTEFIINLSPEADTLFQYFSSNHRRNIRKTIARNTEFKINRDREHLEHHLQALSHTSNRREDRNQGTVGISEQVCKILLSSESAYLAQLYLDGNILSSFLIIETPKRAFYFSGGTTSVGMKLGSSHALMWIIIQKLCEKKIQILSLGGAADSGAVGLDRYKLGFGAKEVKTWTYTYNIGSPIIQKMVWFIRTIRHSPWSLPEVATAWLVRRKQWAVFSWTKDDASIQSNDQTAISVRKLDDQDFETMLSSSNHFRTQTQLYYQQRGISSAYGAFADDSLVHVTWVYTAETYQREPVVSLKLGTDEVELTNCFTLEEFRGHGIYPYAIKTISQELFAKGIKRIYMKTDPGNQISQHGIVKAGLKSVGQVTHYWSPIFPRWDGWYHWQ